MSTLKSPTQCGDLAEKLIADYVRESGAYGNPNALANVIEMLISKAALGIAMVGSEAIAQQILDRTKHNVATFADRNLRRGH
ncbi:hypothetical protein GSH05_09880 [Burkholderia pseudomallei]|uniref:hypothetical protein n=1 Tax=Burkholderia pseudomallei TaxID=28450 RepID=UPI00050E00DE|nr:hypothetical protein [Burkholderia pseudomallei]KGC67461.1 hypothetical protein DP57_2353 [Burkholderia pseudomallei]KGV27474.1 hypothetical protein X894_3598 [Burkholderia pseudomallei MSHR4462]KGV79260.1 hypothetical protein X887_5708 [Burkholderia pseudomallei MSHR4375]MBM5651964.1 hypothetical protein [Burkholderia pseudomallei]ONC75066.1 hypothetical protein AQ921_06875 [Burkholderia pseudomallei]